MNKFKKFFRRLKKIIGQLKLTEWLMILGVLVLIVLIFCLAGLLNGFLLTLGAIVIFSLYYFGGILMRKKRNSSKIKNKKVGIRAGHLMPGSFI